MGRGKFLRAFSMICLLCGWLLLFGVALPSSYGDEGEKEKAFSLVASNERLDVVIGQISRASGYEITVNEGWRSRIVSARLENVTLEEALRLVIEELGRPSHLLVYDRGKKKVEIVLLSTPGAKAEFTGKGEPTAPQREQRQVVMPAPEGSKPVLRPSLRRMRERPQRPVVSQGRTAEQAKPDEAGVDASPEKKGPPDPEVEVGDAPGEGTESPEGDEATQEARGERKAAPLTPRRPAGGAPEKPDSSGP
jgi:hypothetical protein